MGVDGWDAAGGGAAVAAAATDRNSELEAENKRLVDEVAALVEGSAADKRQLEGKVTAVEAEKAAVEAEMALADDRITVVEAERDAGRQQLEARWVGRLQHNGSAHKQGWVSVQTMHTMKV
jgi:predicted  nucleic acid-binding Zn-ribbon protein